VNRKSGNKYNLVGSYIASQLMHGSIFRHIRLLVRVVL